MCPFWSLALNCVSYNKCAVCVQVIIEKAYESMQKDHVKDALSLFVDFMAIFVSCLSLPSQASLPLHNMCVSCVETLNTVTWNSSRH